MIALTGRDALVTAHSPYAQGDWFGEVENSPALHLLASTALAPDWPAALEAYEGRKRCRS